jgi:ParB family transcriptional regulator, chromosome partitioning protein
MPSRKRSGFFGETARPEDDVVRLSEVAALTSVQRVVVQDLAIARLRPNPFQARTTFEGLEELAAAIRSQGFTSRLRVRPDPADGAYFQLLYGERRLRAAILAGLDTVPVEVAEHSDDDMVEIGLAENIQRQDLNPLEEAHAFERFVRDRGYSIRRLAERIGKDKSYIEDRLVLLRAPDDVQAMVVERPKSLRIAREVAKIAEPAARAQMIADVLGGSASTEQVRQAVRAPEPSAGASAQPALAQRIQKDATTITRIVQQWDSLLTENPAAHEAIGPALDATIAALEQIAQRLRVPSS